MSCRPVNLLTKFLSPLFALMIGPMKMCLAADLEDVKTVAEKQAQRVEQT